MSKSKPLQDSDPPEESYFQVWITWNTVTNLVSSADFFIIKLLRREETKLNIKCHLKLRV